MSEARRLRLEGEQLHRLNDVAGALRCFLAALTIEPEHCETLRAAAACHLQLGQPQAALGIFQRIIAAHPDSAGAHFDLGVALEACDDPAGAFSAYGKALALNERHPGARLNLCALLLAQKKFDAALAESERLVALHPDSPDAWYNLAQALFADARPAEADASLRHALDLAPHHAPSLHARVAALAMQGDVEGALALRESLRWRASAPPPAMPGVAEIMRLDRAGFEEMYRNALFERFRRGEWDELPRLRAALASLAAQVRDGMRVCAQPTPAFHAMAFGLELMDYLTLVENHSTHATANVVPLLASTHDKRERLRIGYLSPAFRDHPGAYLFCCLLAAHDRSAVEVFGYALNPDDGSPVRHDIVAGCDRFADLSALDDAQAAAHIRDDGIDILIDVEGYFDGARPRILALRPAPLQTSYAGFLGILEAPCLDYRLADRVTDGTFADLPHAHEQPVYLPGCFLPYGCPQAPWKRHVTRAEHGLPEDAFVFCAFHTDYKIEPESFAAWMRILAAVPDSVLWLIAGSDRHFSALQRHAETEGIVPQRLVRASHLPNDAHLARLRLAGLFLDTFLCNAHTTALDALWMELPVLTRTGKTPASRVCTSALNELGMHDMAMPDTDGYVTRAIELARSSEKLEEVRRRLHVARRDSVLFDPARKAAQLEAAYRRMWTRHEQGLPPAMLDMVNEG